ncbi:hypothetical protein L207DRAFT_633996 [Hyaloscypha variabilis F]|uniref:PA domain-containing protein n=1 Tax=Hyaloscypha variabilis (strain UAMH 11265 / GT02V1 / F) TaxID=1149755 RepID=A0A2J6RLJ1_HYAVF|nr:hypothetical protein L207DRAFT_633996 [Hyaloscypha variabilis F]
MLHSSLVLLSTILISPASAAILRNYTITLPEGTSDHNGPNLLCTPSGWQDIIIFYLGNYIAHVATVISLPGESASSKIRVSLASLLFPVSGLMRGLSTILTFASFGKTDLQKAARAGALCMVVRNQDWRPRSGDTVADAYLEKTKKQAPSRDAAESSNSLSCIRVVDAPWSTIRSVDNTLIAVNPGFTIHGSFSKLAKKGYEIAYVSADAEFEKDFIRESSARKSSASWSLSSVKAAISSCISPPTAPTVISSSYNMIGGLIALAQAIYTSVTLYQTRGDQIDQYGYAAFGLTVAPFVLMSIINLIGSIFSPTYDAIYIVETSVMREARRHECCFDGVVGKLKEGRGALLYSEVEEVNWVESASFGRTGENDQLIVDIVPSTRVDFEEVSSQKPAKVVPGDEENIELSSAGKGAKTNETEEQQESRKFAVAEDNRSEEPDFIIGIPNCPLIGNAASDQNEPRLRPRRTFFYIYFILARIFDLRRTIWQLRHGKSFFSPLYGDGDPGSRLVTEGEPDIFILRTDSATLETNITPGTYNYEPATYMVFLWGLFLALTPIAIVGSLSHFHAGSSTVGQRAWTMAWLGSDIIAGFILGHGLMPADKKATDSRRALGAMIGHTLLFGAPALGGFVVVGQMVTEYGSCITLP